MCWNGKYVVLSAAGRGTAGSYGSFSPFVVSTLCVSYRGGGHSENTLNFSWTVLMRSNRMYSPHCPGIVGIPASCA